jgi:hypothetical protein
LVAVAVSAAVDAAPVPAAAKPVTTTAKVMISVINTVTVLFLLIKTSLYKRSTMFIV